MVSSLVKEKLKVTSGVKSGSGAGAQSGGTNHSESLRVASLVKAGGAP